VTVEDTATEKPAHLPATLHEDVSMELLVPPRRLGRVLAEARVSRGMSLNDVAAALGGALDDLELLEIETGRRPVTDHELEALAGLYEIETSTMVPGRSQLVVDLDEGVIRTRSGEAGVDPADHRQAVLAKYLALVYSMRSAQPGSSVALRLDDLDVLAEAFGADRREIEDELHQLMQGEPEPVRRRFRLLRGRLMVPVVGVMVAATAAGTLVLVPSQESSADEVPTTAGRASAVPTEQVLPSAPEAEIGDAVVQERAADGTPGPVTVRD
jgi:transcriptional regulator with XRE-family HTH domain